MNRYQLNQIAIVWSRKNYLKKISNIDFLIETNCLCLLSDDPEIEKIKQRRLEEMIRQQSQPQIQPGIIDLNDTNFTQIITADTPTLVDFWADWCGPCKMMHPVFESLSKKYPKIRFARVNVDQNQNIAMRFAVQSIPMFIMFKSGQIVDKMMGAVGAPGIHMICKKYSD